MPSYDEEDIQAAISAYKRGDYASISRTSRTFNIPLTTLRNRIRKVTSQKSRNINQQILTPIEEETLENWIYRAAKLGTPISLRLLIILAEEIQKNRNSISAESTLTPISRRWTERFRTRHPRIKTCFTRPIDASRLEGTDYSTLKTYFNRLGELLRENKYPSSAIFNVDETGFSIGSTRGSFTLYDRTATSKGKRQPGRQEWITSIECISASGVTLPPTLIFKGEKLNSEWIPDSTPRDWTFTTSNKGWTNDTLGFEWLTTSFEPFTRNFRDSRCLLLIDGHSSHLTERFIGFCISKNIDLFCLPPHSSHLTQPLDLSIFGPLKTALTFEVDRIFQSSTSRLPRIEWVEAFIKARNKVFRPPSIISGFQKGGIYPYAPEVLLSTLDPPPRTPSPENTNPTRISSASRVLRARGSPKTPTAINLRYIADLTANDASIPSPSKTLIRDLIDFAESRDTDAILARRELREKEDLLNRRRERKKGKRVALKGKFLLSKDEILEVVKNIEKEAKQKKGNKGKNKKIEVIISSDSEGEESLDELAS
jgi:hypothetical protein